MTDFDYCCCRLCIERKPWEKEREYETLASHAPGTQAFRSRMLQMNMSVLNGIDDCSASCRIKYLRLMMRWIESAAANDTDAMFEESLRSHWEWCAAAGASCIDDAIAELRSSATEYLRWAKVCIEKSGVKMESEKSDTPLDHGENLDDIVIESAQD